MGQMDRGQMLNIEAMEQTRMLAHTLAQNSDPKIQVSSYLSTCPALYFYKNMPEFICFCFIPSTVLEFYYVSTL